MFGSNFRDFVSQDATSQGQSNSERLIKSWHGFEKPDSEDSGIEGEEEFEVLDSESQEIPATPCSTPPENLSLENAILANFPDGCDRSFTVESKDEDSYGIIPKSLTFAEIINILNQAVKEDNYERLDEIIQNIEGYKGRSITLDTVNFKDFCEQQLNLDLQNNRHIYSNILSQYKFDQEKFDYHYSVKEFVLLAIAANNKLTEKYQDVFFTEGNLSLLPLLVGGQKYIEAFIKKFHGIDGVYDKLKNQAIQLVEPNKINFFSVIALRKEQELLNAIFVEYILRDFGQVLKTSKPDPLYGVLETASLIKNEEFITIVLGAFERYINEPTKKASTEELLKKSFATLLETAISQEHISVIEYLCKRYTNSADHAIYDVYEQAFAGDKVITILRQQILKNIGARGRKEIYDLVLKTALGAGNIAFIEHLCKECAECSNDVINYLDHKLKNNEFDNTYEPTLIALSNTGSQDIIVNVQIYQSILNNKQQVFRQIVQNILRNAIKEASYEVVVLLCQHVDLKFAALQAICKEEFEKALPVVEEQLEKTSMELFPSMTRNEYQKNRDTLNNLYLIRSLLESSKLINTSSKANIQTQTDTQVNKGSNSDNVVSPIVNVEDTSAMIGETATSNQVVDEENNNQSQNPAPKNQQPQENVDRRENIMNNEKASIEEAIGNDCEEGKMHSSDQNTKTIEEALSHAIFDLDYEKVESLVEQVKQEDNDVERIINRALKKANKTKVGKKDKKSLDKIKKIREFLAKEFKSIAASPVDNSVESIGATTSSHEAPVIEPKESEGNQPNSLSSEDDDYSRLESDKSAGASSGSGSPFEEVSSIATKEAKVNDEQSDNINGDDLTPVSSPVSGDVLTSRSDEEESVVITQGSQNDGEHDKAVPEEHQDDALEKDLIDFSSDDDNSLLGDPVPTSTNEIPEQEDDTQTNGKLPNNPGNGSITATQNTKRYVVAASALAIAGIILGVAVAVYLEMLAVGIAVGACCLVAAAVIYCCTPKSSVESKNVTKLTGDEFAAQQTVN